MSSLRIPRERYTGDAWHGLETDRLWTRTWQIACTVDCVPEPGDHWVYEIAGLSILIVRGEDGALRAFLNTCPHRGNLLIAEADGERLGEIRCPYHHWCFDLEGHLRRVSPQDEAARGSLASFAEADQESVLADPSERSSARTGGIALESVRVDTWGGFVFVNPEAEGESLADYLESLPSELAWVQMERFSCDRFMTIELDCNWKVALDAFIETYHLHAVHPQMLAIADEVNTPITLYDKHTKFVQPYGVPSPRLAERPDDQTIWESFVANLGHRMGIPFAEATKPGPHPTIPEGETIRDVLVEKVRAHLAQFGSIYEKLDDHHVIDDFHYHVFPNSVFNVFAGWFGLIRTRPGATPGTCLLDMWNFDLRREDDPENHPRPVESTLERAEWPALGPVMLQDLELLPLVQKGLAQPGSGPIRLTPAEARIARMHEILERYLDVERAD